MKKHLIPILICFALMTFSANTLSQETIKKQKFEEIDKKIRDNLKSGKTQDVIVEFDSSYADDYSITQRVFADLNLEDQIILNVKKNMYKVDKLGVKMRFFKNEIEEIKDYDALPMSFIKVKSEGALKKLLSQPEVVKIYENAKHKPTLLQSLPLISQPAAIASGRRGGWTSVAVLDTGTDYRNPAFGSCTAPGTPATCRVRFAADFAPNDNSLDANGHGTNVAGIVAGTAPDTRILALDVFNGSTAFTSDIINAINWVINNRVTFNIVSMNLSLGADLNSAIECTGSWASTPFMQARLVGVIAVVASGNNARTNGIGNPACATSAVSVGAVYDTDVVTPPPCYSTTTDVDDKVTCFSNTAPRLNLLAPGSIISAAGLNMIGTSQAAPHVAGAIAILRGNNAFPGESLERTINRLTSSGKLVLDTRSNMVIPRLNINAALMLPNLSISYRNPIQNYPNGWNFDLPSPWTPITGDFNGDGRTDYVRLGGPKFHVFLSNKPLGVGDASFQSLEQFYPNGWNFDLPSPWTPITGDFNGDGRTDYARLGGPKFHVFLSNGNGSFQSLEQFYPNGWNFDLPSPWTPITGDFNGDGRTDYARLGGSKFHVFLSNGNGSFQSLEQFYPNGWNFDLPSPWTTITGDFNGDGRTDYARLGGPKFHVFLSNGNGSFQSLEQFYPNGWNFDLPSPWTTITGDFNGDGRTDYARLGGKYSHVFVSQGNGTFRNQIQNYPAGWDFGLPSPWTKITGDFNGDGRTDYARLGGKSFYVFLSNGNGSFQSVGQSYPNGWDFGLPSPWTAITGDFNGDRKTDYIRLGGAYSHMFIVQ